MSIRSLVVASTMTAIVTVTAFSGAHAEAPKKAPTTAPKRAELTAAEAEKFLAFFNKFVDTVVASKEDCAKLISSINTLIDSSQDVLKKLQEAKAANKEYPASVKDKMRSRASEMKPAMVKCGNEPAFLAAMKRMEGSKAAAPTEKKAETKTEPKTEPKTDPKTAPKPSPAASATKK